MNDHDGQTENERTNERLAAVRVVRDGEEAVAGCRQLQLLLWLWSECDVVAALHSFIYSFIHRIVSIAYNTSLI